MTNIQILEKKILQLEERVGKLEAQLADTEDQEEKAYMDQLYSKAKENVIREHKSTAIFLQKKLLIDFARATKLLERLKSEGVIDEVVDEGVKKSLVK